MKKITLSKKSSLFLLGLFLITIFFFNQKARKLKKTRDLNPKYTIGQVIDYTSGGRGSKGFYTYKYYVGKNYLTGNYRANEKLNTNEFYRIKYERNNPDNSELISPNKTISAYELSKKGLVKKARIERKYYLNGDFYDLYIAYKFEGKTYKFRTRLSHNELQCNTPRKCSETEMSIKILKEYPLINDLYFTSYDRQSLKRRKSKIHVEYKE